MSKKYLILATLLIGTLPYPTASQAARGWGNWHGPAVGANDPKFQKNKDKSKDQKDQTADQDQPPTTQPGDSDAMAQASAEMDAAEKKVKAHFESSPDWSAAQSAFQDARSDEANARQTVLKTLKNSSAYQSAQQTCDKAQADLDKLHNTPNPSTDDLMTASNAMLQAKTAVSKLEADANAADPNVAAAKTRISAATGKLSELRRQEQTQIAADTDYQAAKQKFDDAKKDKIAAAK